MKIDTIKTSFAAGQFSAALFGRTDIAQYNNACEIVQNFLPRPAGSVISTPGTEFITEGKTGGSTGIIRVIPFKFSRTDAYVIETGVSYFRFYTAGAQVVSPGTTPYEVAHTYTASEIPEFDYAQRNDLVYQAHGNHAPQVLTRFSATSWTLTDLAFVGGPFAPVNEIYSSGTTTLYTSATITPSGTNGNITLSASDNLFVPSASTNGHLNTFWRIGATTTDSTTGLDVQGYVQITAITNPSTATATVRKPLSAATATTIWAEGAWSDLRGYPARVTLHEQRLFFARTTAQPQGVWGSKTFEFENFAVDGGADGDALDIELVADESNDIKWLSPGQTLIAGTYDGEFSIESGDGSPLTPSNSKAPKQTSWGSESVIPKRIGNFVYYVQRFGRKIRELFFNFDTLNGYKSVDKTILAPDIHGSGFTDLAYQQNPDTIIWALCTDGTISTMTREVDQEVTAWAKQTTDGIYESITSIPSASEPHDEIWVVVNRTIDGSTKRYIERFKSQLVPDRQDQCFYVHSGLSYDAYAATSTNPTAASISLGAHAMTVGANIVITSNTGYFSSNDVGQRIRAVNTSGGTIGEINIKAYTSSTVISGTVAATFSALAYSAGEWGLSVNSISGLDHLEAETITVLADGGTDLPSKVVSSGAITIGNNSFIVHAGIPYKQIIKTLPQEAGSERGTSQGKKQRINEVAFKVNRSFKGFKVGGSAALAERVVFRDPSTPMGSPELLFTGTIPNIPFHGDYTEGVQVYIENEVPLPIELLNIITSLDTHDK